MTWSSVAKNVCNLETSAARLHTPSGCTVCACAFPACTACGLIEAADALIHAWS